MTFIKILFSVWLVRKISYWQLSATSGERRWRILRTQRVAKNELHVRVYAKSCSNLKKMIKFCWQYCEYIPFKNSRLQFTSMSFLLTAQCCRTRLGHDSVTWRARFDYEASFSVTHDVLIFCTNYWGQTKLDLPLQIIQKEPQVVITWAIIFNFYNL